MGKKERREKLVCFDLDDTLIHADKAHVEAYTEAFKKFGLPRPSVKNLMSRFGIIASVFVRDFYPFLNDNEVNAIIQEHRKILLSKTKRFAKPIQGAVATLQQLRPHYRLALVTNCRRPVAYALLHAAKIPPSFFDVIITYNPKLHPKPAPDEIFKASHLLHHKADYMVGDTIYDVIAAKKAGAKAIAVLTGNHSRRKLASYKPWKIVSSVAEVPRLLLKK